jgi:SHS2 domain-containing protein
VPYRWLEDIAIADAAFEAWAPTPEELLVEAGEAVLEAMAGDPARVDRKDRREVTLEDSPDFLLVRLLQALLWHKDAEQMLLHIGPVTLTRGSGARDGAGGAAAAAGADTGRWKVFAELWGERIDPARHDGVDVKAVTLHRLFLGQEPDGSWRARAVLDV